jgi:hypothetical protein
MTNPPSPKELPGEYDVCSDVRHKEQDAHSRHTLFLKRRGMRIVPKPEKERYVPVAAKEP